MKINEYNNKMVVLKNEYNEKVSELKKEYALLNNIVKVGDIVTDHIGSVKVDKILVWETSDPSCVYKGTEYTKAGKPTKRGNKRNVYQINLEMHTKIN